MHLHSLSSLAEPVSRETLFLYFNINNLEVNSILVKEMACTQIPLYYVRKLFTLNEKKYIKIKKYLYGWFLFPKSYILISTSTR